MTFAHLLEFSVTEPTWRMGRTLRLAMGVNLYQWSRVLGELPVGVVENELSDRRMKPDYVEMVAEMLSDFSDISNGVEVDRKVLPSSGLPLAKSLAALKEGRQPQAGNLSPTASKVVFQQRYSGLSHCSIGLLLRKSHRLMSSVVSGKNEPPVQLVDLMQGLMAMHRCWSDELQNAASGIWNPPHPDEFRELLDFNHFLPDLTPLNRQICLNDAYGAALGRALIRSQKASELYPRVRLSE